MADGSVRTPGTGENVATFDVGTYQGVTNAKVQVLHGVYVTGSPGSHTLNEIHGNSEPATTVYGLNARVVPQPVSVSGAVTTASTNATVVKSSPGRLLAVHIYSSASTEVFVKFHNTASTPTAGVSVTSPRVGCQAGQDAHFVLQNGGKLFTTGISYTVVSDIADTGTVAGAADVIVEVEYV